MIFVWYKKSGQIFLPFCHNPRVWRTAFSSLYRICIPCSTDSSPTWVYCHWV